MKIYRIENLSKLNYKIVELKVPTKFVVFGEKQLMFHKMAIEDMKRWDYRKQLNKQRFLRHFSGIPRSTK